GDHDRGNAAKRDSQSGEAAVLQSGEENGNAGIALCGPGSSIRAGGLKIRPYVLGEALLFPFQYNPAPMGSSKAEPPATFIRASGLLGSSGWGMTEIRIVKLVMTSPMMEIATATGLPPGTRMISGPAGSLCSLIIAAKR